MKYYNQDMQDSSESVHSFIVRGGRLRKQGGQVVSYSPQIAEYFGSASRAAMGAALLVGSALGLAPAAVAGTCAPVPGTPGSFVCSGGASSTNVDAVIAIVDPTVPVTTAAGFGVSTNAGTAITITQATAGVSFTDANGSVIKGTTGGLSISAAGDVTVVADSAFNALDGNAVSVTNASGNQGKINVSLSGEIEATDTGVSISQAGDGSVTLNLADTAEIVTSDEGVSVEHLGEGSTALTTAANIASQGSGILVLSDDKGSVAINNSGTVKSVGTAINGIMGANADGALAITNSGNLTNTAPGYGVAAVHNGTGDITLTNSAVVKATNGLYALHEDDGNISVTNSAAGVVNADVIGINVAHNGAGNVDVANNGAINTVAGNGINVDSDTGGAVKIVNTGTIKAGVDYDPDEDIGSGNYNGIVSNSAPGSVVEITNAGAITAYNYGIDAYFEVDGDFDPEDEDAVLPTLTITNSSIINALSGGGIYADVDGVGDAAATIKNTGTITSAEDGIHADWYDASGVLEVENTGTITSVGDGIVLHVDGDQGNVDVVIKNSGTIAATGDSGSGISVSQYASGDVTISSSGTITSKEGHGIAVYHGGDEGAVRITAANTSSAGDDSIGIVVNTTDAPVFITTTGTVSGDFAAVAVEADADNVSITNTATGVLQNLSGASADLAVWSVSDPDAVYVGNVNTTPATTLTNAGRIVGTVRFDGGDDVIVNSGVWTTTNGTNYLGAGADTITIASGGVWNAIGSTTHFDLMDDDDQIEGPGDALVIAAGGTLNAGNTTFTGLELLTLSGTLSSVNGVVGQTVETDGDVVINANSVFHVETGANGVSDSLIAGGEVEIKGGTLRATHVGTNAPTIGNEYTVIEADEVTGKFTNTTIANTAFLGWEIDYTATTVDLTYAQLRDFDAAGQTANQIATAKGADSLPVTNPLFLAIANLPNDAAARAAFEGLSGEIHPGARTAMMEDSRLPRNAVLERLQTPTSGAIWGQGFWNSGSSDGAKNGNTAKIDRETWGALLGVDFPLGENGVFGVAGSYLSNDLEQLDRRSKGSVDSWHALGYIGAQAGMLNLKAGVGYAWGSIDTTRTVTVGALNNTLIADYDSTLLQAFAEAGVRLPLSGGYVEPMANVIYLKAKSDAFTETGGSAALEAKKASDNNTLLTVGSRFSTASLGAFSVRGMLGWQHVFGSRIPYTNFNFAGGSTFTIAGVSQSRDAAVANIEANFALGENSALGIGYDGVVGKDNQDHAAKVSLRFAF